MASVAPPATDTITKTSGMSTPMTVAFLSAIGAGVCATVFFTVAPLVAERTAPAPASWPAGTSPGVWDLPSSSTKGRLAANGASLGGAWTFEAGKCESGERIQFHGVDLFDKSDPKHVVRVADDALSGPSVSTNRPGSNQGWKFVPSECKTLQVEIRRTNVIVNRIRGLEGDAVVDCTLPDGTTFAGRIDFAGCY